jgi:hypothetical protein
MIRLMQLNNDMLQIRLNTESNSQTLYLLSYNVCKYLNENDIYVEDII